MDSEKTALVLGGGGSRGAYEVGVWQALKELAIPIHMVFGTSVGAINGALIAQDAFETAAELWRQLETSMVFDIEKDGPLTYLSEILACGGIDAGGIKKMLEKHIDEQKVRNSSLDYGIVTVELPKGSPLYLMKEQIPSGKLIDYILASAACFPAFKRYEIDMKKYVDGGYSDNLPVCMAQNNGADKIIAVDLEAPGIIKAKNLEDAEHLKLVKSHWNLGNFLIFDKENTQRLLRMGYLDTLKSYGIYEGKYYTFVKGQFEKSMLDSADAAARIFELPAETIYLKSVLDRLLTEAILPVQKEQIDGESTETMLEKLTDNAHRAKLFFSRQVLTLLLAEWLGQAGSDASLLMKTAASLFKEELAAAEYIHDLLSV